LNGKKTYIGPKRCGLRRLGLSVWDCVIWACPSVRLSLPTGLRPAKQNKSSKIIKTRNRYKKNLPWPKRRFRRLGIIVGTSDQSGRNLRLAFEAREGRWIGRLCVTQNRRICVLITQELKQGTKLDKFKFRSRNPEPIPVHVSHVTTLSWVYLYLSPVSYLTHL
jgi:hypothetical protein